MVQRFASLSNQEAELLYNLFEPPYSVQKKQHILVEGKQSNSLFFLWNGYLRGYYRKDGEEITTNFYFGPNFFGDMASIRSKMPTRLNVQALEDVQVQEAEFSKVETLATQYPGILRLFLNFVEHLYLFNHHRQISFLYDTPTERYLKLFKERPKVIANIPLQYIASYLGMNPETLSRIRRKIQEEEIGDKRKNH